MALKLLNPGLRPLGMFDLDDESNGALVGGEYVELQQADEDDAEAYAADVGQLTDTGGMLSFAPATSSTALGGLADEGVDEYGTLFGSLIGANTGKATSQSGAVVIGPATDRASGKVTVWAQAGLYGVSGDACTFDDTPLAANAAVDADAGVLGGTGAGAQMGIYVGAMTDSSLVSTTNAAAGLAAATEYHAVFHQGN